MGSCKVTRKHEQARKRLKQGCAAAAHHLQHWGTSPNRFFRLRHAGTAWAQQLKKHWPQTTPFCPGFQGVVPALC